MDRWFSKLRHDGLIASGFGNIWVGERHIGSGIGPKWLDDNTLLVKAEGDKRYVMNASTGAKAAVTESAVAMHAAGGGTWMVSDAQKIWVAVGRDGSQAWIEEHNGQNRDHSVMLNGVEVFRGLAHWVSVERECLTWVQFEPTALWGRLPGGTPQKLLDRGIYGVPVWTPQGWWVVGQRNEDLCVFPWGESEGYIIRTGENLNFNPDALWVNGRILVVWNLHNGEGGMQAINPAQPRERLIGTQPQPQPEPQPKPEEPKPVQIPTPDPKLVKVVNDYWRDSKIAEYTAEHFDEKSEAEWKHEHAKVLFEALSLAYYDMGIQSFGVYPKSGGTRFKPFPDSDEGYGEDIIQLKNDTGVMFWKDVGIGFGAKHPSIGWGEFSRSSDSDQHPGAYKAPPRLTIPKPEPQPEPKPDPKPDPTPEPQEPDLDEFMKELTAAIVASVKEAVAEELKRIDDELETLRTELNSMEFEGRARLIGTFTLKRVAKKDK